ncbi:MULTISPECIES: response regulator transcription factor [Pseudofrankia]|uniref:response regulator transcription factor n=1 Tax=Pseudofrankia TaxID=2994363 RepID=UPI000234CA9F
MDRGPAGTPTGCRAPEAPRDNGPVPAPANTGRVLVVDDEPSIRDAVATALRYEGFDVGEAATGRSALQSASEQPPDVVILDLMLPDIDGVKVCRQLRAAGQDCHVLFLTARGNLANKVTGLGAGGDDYITKPFSLAEIVARTNAVMRRRAMSMASPPVELLGQASQDGSTPSGSRRLVCDDVVLDLDCHQVWRAGVAVHLTATEFRLLAFFLNNAQRVLSKQQILDAVWDEDFRGTPNIVEAYVGHLRRKLDQHGPSLIKTVRLVGYALHPQDGTAALARADAP